MIMVAKVITTDSEGCSIALGVSGLLLGGFIRVMTPDSEHRLSVIRAAEIKIIRDVVGLVLLGLLEMY